MDTGGNQVDWRESSKDRFRMSPVVTPLPRQGCGSGRRLVDGEIEQGALRRSIVLKEGD